MLRNFLKDTSGATAIEYALIAENIRCHRERFEQPWNQGDGLFTKVDNALN